MGMGPCSRAWAASQESKMSVAEALESASGSQRASRHPAQECGRDKGCSLPTRRCGGGGGGGGGWRSARATLLTLPGE
jgi:hypothetical protein